MSQLFLGVLVFCFVLFCFFGGGGGRLELLQLLCDHEESRQHGEGR